MVVSTFSFAHDDTSAVSDLRGWSEQQLIAAAKTGRRAPFGELCERHRKRVSHVTRRIMRNREDAEDAAQECFLNAFVHLKDFDGRSTFACKVADVSRENRAASNALAAECRQLQLCQAG